MKQHERGNMTHNTDAERAEFEAAYVSEKLRIIGSDGSSDGEKAIRAIHLRRNANGEYDNSLEAHFAWWAWQAARRAPAAPVPQCEPVGSVYTMEALVPGGREVHHVSLYMPLPAGTKLYAAPQPPEAAPVEFPEPVAYRLRNTAFRSEVYEYFRTKYLAECRQKQFNASVDDGGLHELTPLYTEQQVRDLLDAHGIGKDKA